ncbi:MAG: hypothetical protein JWR77_1628 [Rhizorhabdus sp.]|nr:hypothetical protein [Rhizorhabdus sp.]
MKKSPFNSLILAGGSLAAIVLAAPAHAQNQTATPADQPAEAAAQPGGIDGDIVVTARRRAESIQAVPVSVQAFTAVTLERQNIRSTVDLQRLTPGVVFNGSGSDFNTTLTIRGQGRDVIGPIAPSVQSYVNEVSLPSWGAVIPTYDVSNIQVLKGPQGTLFGRNTTGGAILVYTKQPTYELGGYGQVLIGNYDWKEFEGAVNLPIIADKLAVRVAGQIRRRDGYVKGGLPNLPDAQDVHNDNFRGSVLVEPVEGVKNVTVYDYSKVNIHANSLPMGYGIGTGANGEFAAFHFIGSSIYGTVGGTNALFDCGTSPTCDPDLAIAREKSVNFKRYYTSLVPFTHATVQGITNTTTIEAGDVTIKNILGFRKNRIHEASDTDGTELAIIDAYRVLRSDDQLSDELQVSGSLFGDSLKWLAGGFYLKNKPKGPNSISYNLYQPSAANVAANPFLGFVSPFLQQVSEASLNERTKAIFLSLSQDLGSVVSGLKLNVSGRYTWDDIKSCSANLLAPQTPSADYDACTKIPGVANTSGSFKKFTWSAGVDYQVTNEVFLYAVARRGYRAGGINTPNLGGSFAPFQTFGPQTVTDGEIGVKADWTVGTIRGRTNISAYVSKFTGLQQQAAGIPPNADGDNDPTTDPTSTALIINAGTAKTRGIDLDGFVIPFEGFQFTYGLALFHGKIDLQAPAALNGLLGSNTTFDRAPKRSYSLAGNYTLPTGVLGGRLSFDLNYYWTASYKVGLAPFKSYGLLNGYVALNNVGGTGIDLQVFGQNLADKTYFANPNASGPSPGYITESLAPPRMYGLRASYKFGGG